MFDFLKSFMGLDAFNVSDSLIFVAVLLFCVVAVDFFRELFLVFWRYLFHDR